MAKCANCPEEAVIEYPISPTDSLLFCNKDMPNFLFRPEFKNSYHVISPQAEAPVTEEVAAKKKNNKTSTEETPITETPAEAEGE